MARIVLAGAIAASAFIATPAFAGADTHEFNLERTQELREERAEMREEISEKTRDAARKIEKADTREERREARSELKREIREEKREARRDAWDDDDDDKPVLFQGRASARRAPREGGGMRELVSRYAAKYGVPQHVAHGVVMVESRYNAKATGAGGYIGLMQIGYRTAKGMGYGGSRAGLYNPETNLDYGMRYLGEAYRQAGGNLCGAVSKYQGGHGVRGVTRAGAAYCGKVKKYMAQEAPAENKADNRKFALRGGERS
jgi:soluble lytic murein transglycosylase-like protein